LEKKRWLPKDEKIAYLYKKNGGGSGKGGSAEWISEPSCNGNQAPRPKLSKKTEGGGRKTKNLRGEALGSGCNDLMGSWEMQTHDVAGEFLGKKTRQGGHRKGDFKNNHVDKRKEKTMKRVDQGRERPSNKKQI